MKPKRLKASKEMIVAGFMSGSSLDGLDVALCKFTMDKDGIISYQVMAAETIPYEAEWIENLEYAINFTVKDFFSFVTDYSHYISMIAGDYCRIMKIQPDLVASHGHTLDHRPEDGLSVQIGDPGIISAVMGIDCVADFRIQDITLGGEGAPIVPIAEKLLWPEFTAFINLGGIANVSIHGAKNIIAWDSVPCNQVLNDQAMILGAEYDEDGVWASEGKLKKELIEQWDQMSFFNEDIPKSLDNNWIKDEYLPKISELRISPEDALHTSCHFIAQKIATDIEKYTDVLPKKIMVTGGGAYNTYLLNCIKDQLQPLGIEIFMPEDILVNYKEAIMIALMGYLFKLDIENTIPSVTGASRAVVAGKYCKA